MRGQPHQPAVPHPPPRTHLHRHACTIAATITTTTSKARGVRARRRSRVVACGTEVKQHGQGLAGGGVHVHHHVARMRVRVEEPARTHAHSGRQECQPLSTVGGSSLLLLLAWSSYPSTKNMEEKACATRRINDTLTGRQAGKQASRSRPGRVRRRLLVRARRRRRLVFLLPVDLVVVEHGRVRHLEPLREGKRREVTREPSATTACLPASPWPPCGWCGSYVRT